MKKSKFQELLENSKLLNSKPKKSLFQQRLDEAMDKISKEDKKPTPPPSQLIKEGQNPKVKKVEERTFKELVTQTIKNLISRLSPAEDHQSQTAQPPVTTKETLLILTAPPYNTLLNWKSVEKETPPYYHNVHVWDGRSMNINWARAWSEELEQDVYVNNRNDSVISTITHWTEPRNMRYNINDLMTLNLKLITIKEVQDIIDELNELIEDLDYDDPEFNDGIKTGIRLMEKLVESKRMTKP